MTLIAHITDLHLRPRGLPCYRVSDTNMFAERAVAALNALLPRPDAVIMTGDLTDTSDPREYALARQILSRLDMPVYLIPGNHDGTADMCREMAAYPGMSDGVGGKLCYTADIGSMRLIALDTSLQGQPQGALGDPQLAWLKERLEEDDRPTLIALHHPPALSGISHMDAIGLTDAPALAEVIRPFSHIDRLLCGHLHRPIVAGFAGKIMTLAPSTAHQVVLDLTEEGPALFNFEPPAYFLHHHTEKAGTVTHMAYVEAFPGPHHFFADEGVSWPGEGS
jgi:3',5'-cyclic AMP phosphodiesterase CpdA